MRAAFALLALILTTALAAGCGNIAEPRGWAAPVVRGDVVLLSHDSGRLGAYRLTGGGRIWEFPAKDVKEDLSGIYGTPAAPDDLLYVTGYNGSVAAVTAADGTQRWRHKVGERVVGGALVTADSVYAGNDAGELVALNRADGSERWRTKVGNEVWSTPVTDGTAIIIPAMDGVVTAFNPDGSRRWQAQIGDAGIGGKPALLDGILYLGSFDKRLYAVDAATGDVRWRSDPADNWFWTEPLIDGDNLYAGNMDGHVYAVDLTSGALRWRVNVEAPVRGRPALAGGVLLAPARDGRLWGLRPASGEQAWPPLPIGGDLYADLTVAGDTVLAASEVGKKSVKLFRVDAARGDASEIPLAN